MVTRVDVRSLSVKELAALAEVLAVELDRRAGLGVMRPEFLDAASRVRDAHATIVQAHRQLWDRVSLLPLRRLRGESR